MDRPDVIRLLQERQHWIGTSFDGETIAWWLRELETVDYGLAWVAMRRACTKHERVTFHAFTDELRAYEHGLRNRGDEHHEHEYTGPVIDIDRGMAIAHAEAEAVRRGRRAAVGLPETATSEELWRAEREHPS